MAGGLPAVHHSGCDEGHTAAGDLSGGQVARLNGLVSASQLLHLLPPCGERWICERSVSEANRLRGLGPRLGLAEAPPHPDSIAPLRCARNPASPRTRGEVERVARPVLLPAGRGFALRLALGPLLGLELLAGQPVDALHGQAHL